MTFSLLITWAAFIITSVMLALVAIAIVYETFFQSDLDKKLQDMKNAKFVGDKVYIPKTTYFNYRTGVAIAIWIGSGVLLFG